jgi:6-phosphogluconolactonase
MNVHVSKNPDELNNAVANWMVNEIELGLQKTDRFALLLSGGNTPKKLYELLASDAYRDKIDWEKVDIFFGDERVVPFEDERNNGRMANDALLSKVPIPKDHQFFIDTSKQPEIAAEEYESQLRGYFADTKNTFDLVLLGMGEDGHTLSIFPGSEKNLDGRNWVISVHVPEQNMDRVSLTPSIVNKSRLVAFLVEGSAKSTVLQKILDEKNSAISFPAQLIKPQQGELHWFVDEAAAQQAIGNRQQAT